MKGRRDLLIGVTFLVVFVSLAIGERILATRVVAEAAGVQAPMFEVDPLWPKPLPNHWVMGNTIGVSADAQDHIWIIHRAGSLEDKEIYAAKNPPQASCCLPAPAVLEFDQAGNCCTTGAARREKATNGRIPITGSRSTTKVMSGSAETALAPIRMRRPAAPAGERLEDRLRRGFRRLKDKQDPSSDTRTTA